jgi:D-methionine transport system substrate-binding protein
MVRFLCSLLSLLFCLGCSQNKENSLKVAASSVPHAEILESTREELKNQGINLDVVEVDDYNIPNRALAHGEVDANFFQHTPFLEEQIKQFSYPIENIAAIEIEPMGIYSHKVDALSKLPEGAKIALPNDPSNEARALLLLQHEGLIELDRQNNLHATILNIKKNPKRLTFLEVDAAMLPRTLEDVDAAVINTNYALAAGLNPLRDALALENEHSPYANILVVRKGDETRPEIQALKKALTSEKTKRFILDHYQGAVLPAF